MVYKRVFWLFFLVLTAINIYIYINRKNGYEYVKQNSYAGLYPNISKGVDKITIEKDYKVVIDLKGFPSSLKWHISCDGNILAANLSMPLRFVLKEKLKRYLLIPDIPISKPIIIDLDYSPSSLYGISGKTVATNYEIRYCSIPFATDDIFAVTKWKDPLDYMDAAEITIVKKIITDILHIKKSDSTAAKIKAIGQYIFNSIQPNIGIPADTLNKYSVYQQFCKAKEGKAKIWCGNISDIFHLFATTAGIICRKIVVTGNINEFGTGGHVVNECYIKETGEWAYVDVTQNILLLQNSNDSYLNTVDLYQLKKQDQTNKIIQWSAGDSSIVKSGYDNADKKYIWAQNDLLFPYPYDPKTLYSFSHKFIRYVSKHPWFEMYSENYRFDNCRFYLKSYVFQAWILTGLVMLVLILSTKKVNH